MKEYKRRLESNVPEDKRPVMTPEKRREFVVDLERLMREAEEETRRHELTPDRNIIVTR